MPEKFFARPYDQSLQAFKDWLQGMTEALRGPDAEPDDSMTEEDWVQRWQEFWSEEPASDK